MSKKESRIWNLESRVPLVLFSLIFLAAACNNNSGSIVNKSATVTIGDQALNVQVAESILAQNMGLSNRDSMRENDGMLFIFPSPGRYAFWMKDMKFPIDFIWIKNNKVLEITPNVPYEPAVSDAPLHSYLPSQEIDSVIEVNAGWTAKNEIKVGDPVRVSQP